MTAIPTAPSAGRRYDIDALRVLAFGLLILYHVGMFYVADWGWHIKSLHVAEWLQWPMLVVNQWRMPLLFLIAGVAARFVLRRAGPGAFARSRTRRLLVPLLFGMAVVVPPQAYFQAVANGAFEGDYGAFLLRYLTFQPWPEDAFDGSHVGVTWNHLWFLPYLLAYSLLLAAALPVLRGRAGLAVQSAFRALRGWRLLVLPVVPLTLATWALSAHFPTTHDLVSDWHTHVQYLAMFVCGYWMGTDEGLWAELRARRRMLLGASALTFAVFAVLRLTTEPVPSWDRALYDFAQRLYGWMALLTVLAWGHHLLNRPFRWLPYATEAVYPWYVLHQTITVVAGAGLSALALGPVVEPVLLIAATALGCLVLHEYVVRRTHWLRPVFGLGVPARAAQPGGERVARGFM